MGGLPAGCRIAGPTAEISKGNLISTHGLHLRGWGMPDIDKRHDRKAEPDDALLWLHWLDASHVPGSGVAAGSRLHTQYGDVISEPLPARMLELLAELQQKRN